MRDIINKGITEEHLLHSIDLATLPHPPRPHVYHDRTSYGNRRGHRGHCDDDQARAAHMASIGNKGKITLSINPFIPKPCTPFQWMAMTDQKTVEKRLSYIKKALDKDKQIEILAETAAAMLYSGVLARGDRRVGQLLALAHQYGGVKGWKRA